MELISSAAHNPPPPFVLPGAAGDVTDRFPRDERPAIYTDEWSQVFHGDCRNIVWRFDQKFAVVSDPPYGMSAEFNRKGRKRKTSKKGQAFYNTPERDKVAGDQEPFDPAHLLDFKFIALFGGNHFANRLPNFSKWLGWDKRGGVEPDCNSDFEMIWTNQHGAARLYTHLWKGIVREGRENVANGPKLHEAQKPIALMKWIILELKIPRDVIIIDPYCGSGSTLVAAKELGYKSIGIDTVEKHCTTTVARVKQDCLSFD